MVDAMANVDDNKTTSKHMAEISQLKPDFKKLKEKNPPLK
jgi:hypothetical protein